MMVKKKVEEIVEDIKAEAAEDVATFTIDRWHVALAAVLVTTIIFTIAL